MQLGEIMPSFMMCREACWIFLAFTDDYLLFAMSEKLFHLAKKCLCCTMQRRILQVLVDIRLNKDLVRKKRLRKGGMMKNTSVIEK